MSFEKRNEGVVDVRIEAASLLREIASPGMPGESVKAAIGRAARRAGMPYGRVRSLWYQLAVVGAAEWLKLQSVAQARRQRVDQTNEAAGRMDYAEVLAKLERIERALDALASDRIRAVSD